MDTVDNATEQYLEKALKDNINIRRSMRKLCEFLRKDPHFTGKLGFPGLPFKLNIEDMPTCIDTITVVIKALLQDLEATTREKIYLHKLLGDPYSPPPFP